MSKVLFVGNSKSGKTTTCRQLIGQYDPKLKMQPTIGVEIHTYKNYSIWEHCVGVTNTMFFISVSPK